MERSIKEQVGAATWESWPVGARMAIADAQATIAALTEALDCALLEKPLPNGEYVHHAACNGDRRKPAGAIGISCSCRVGRATIAALQAQHKDLCLRNHILRDRVKRASFHDEVVALQARVQELEEWVSDQSNANLQTMRHLDDMQTRAMEAEAQLTQRTAELEAANKHCEIIEERKAEAYKEVEIQLLAKADLQAELERVKGKLSDMRAKHPEDSCYGAMPKLRKEVAELRTLIAALPKVEGGIETWDHDNGLMFTCSTRPVSRYAITFRSSEERDAYAALLQHRQGMEG